MWGFYRHLIEGRRNGGSLPIDPTRTKGGEMPCPWCAEKSSDCFAAEYRQWRYVLADGSTARELGGNYGTPTEIHILNSHEGRVWYERVSGYHALLFAGLGEWIDPKRGVLSDLTSREDSCTEVHASTIILDDWCSGCGRSGKLNAAHIAWVFRPTSFKDFKSRDEANRSNGRYVPDRYDYIARVASPLYVQRRQRKSGGRSARDGALRSLGESAAAHILNGTREVDAEFERLRQQSRTRSEGSLRAQWDAYQPYLMLPPLQLP